MKFLPLLATAYLMLSGAALAWDGSQLCGDAPVAESSCAGPECMAAHKPVKAKPQAEAPNRQTYFDYEEPSA